MKNLRQGSNLHFFVFRGLVVMETTNDVLNRSLFQYVTQHSLLSWMRAILANRMALSGKTWTSIFAQYNSGTYPFLAVSLLVAFGSATFRSKSFIIIII